MNYPRVFVIILNYNGGDILKKCLESVYKLKYPNFQVVVVDNNSADNSFEEAQLSFGKFNFIKNSQNIGFAGGNNVAIKWALEKMADFVFLLNNDALVEKDTLDKLVFAAQKDRSIGILSPVIYKDKSKNIWFSGGKIDWFKMKAIHQNDIRYTQYITGCAMLVRKEVFKKIGLLDEKFFLYYEDVDFSFRARKNNFKLKIVSIAKVFHFEKSAESLNKFYFLVISGIIFFRKNSNLLLRIYIEVYLLLRKIKNRLDILKNKNNKVALIVRRAYREFR
ncbi:MAG: glycosyltransferase family 2 protein [Parcubacteria group bacterium]|jgi:hypothetical protein